MVLRGNLGCVFEVICRELRELRELRLRLRDYIWRSVFKVGAGEVVNHCNCLPVIHSLNVLVDVVFTGSVSTFACVLPPADSRCDI